MPRQVQHIRDGIKDQIILEQEKVSEGRSREQLEEKIVFLHHTIFLQCFTLYILPLVIGLVAYFVIKLLGLLA